MISRVLEPDAGHWIQQELPEDTNAATLEFLEGLWAATTPRQTAPSSLT